MSLVWAFKKEIGGQKKGFVFSDGLETYVGRGGNTLYSRDKTFKINDDFIGGFTYRRLPTENWDPVNALVELVFLFGKAISNNVLTGLATNIIAKYNEANKNIAIDDWCCLLMNKDSNLYKIYTFENDTTIKLEKLMVCNESIGDGAINHTSRTPYFTGEDFENAKDKKSLQDIFDTVKSSSDLSTKDVGGVTYCQEMDIV